MTNDIRVLTVDIPGPSGLLEGLINAQPGREPRAIAVLAHPPPTAGGTMHTKALSMRQKGCRDRRTGSAIQFPRRRSKRGFVCGRTRRTGDFRAALEFMTKRS